MTILENLSEKYLGVRLSTPKDFEPLICLKKPKVIIEAQPKITPDGKLDGCFQLRIEHPIIQVGVEKPLFSFRLCLGPPSIDLYIDEIFIRPKYQNQGHGTRIVKHIIDWSIEHNVTRLIAIADRKEGVCGYAFFPTLGFDTPLDESWISKDLLEKIMTSGFFEQMPKTLQEFLEYQGAKEWWRINGEQVTLFLDLAVSSTKQHQTTY